MGGGFVARRPAHRGSVRKNRGGTLSISGRPEECNACRKPASVCRPDLQQLRGIQEPHDADEDGFARLANAMGAGMINDVWHLEEVASFLGLRQEQAA